MTDIVQPKIQMTISGVMRTYMPREDITAFEAAKIYQLIAVSCVSPMKAEDRDAYVTHYGLLRHFE